ncbi:hypothetical protein [Dactylosporangium darangshiense]|uniref:Rho termination factor N-terminal domain-containing protein n=1 Tax=Dactylosporangium darangshiense TaxID=579108 RepID=A0ABP8DVE1_9ACTN
MIGPSRVESQRQVKHAFRGVPRLPAEDVVLEQYRHNIDAQEMASAFGGRHWRELSLEELYAEAKRRDIKGRSKVTRADLDGALR